MVLVIGAAVPAVALAHLQLSLKISVPKHVKRSTPITVSGVVNGELGAEFLSVFFDTRKCARSYTIEDRASGSGGAQYKVGSLLSADEQGPFSATVKLGKFGKRAKYICAYYWHTRNAAGQSKTDRVYRIHV